MEDFIIKKCEKCGNLVKVIGSLKCEMLSCCNDEMTTVKENSEDASFEKHVPSYEIKNDKLEVTVNHVMDKDHFIEWICFKTENREEFVYLKDEAKATFPYQKGTLYAYCNKHGLWSKEVQ